MNHALFILCVIYVLTEIINSEKSLKSFSSWKFSESILNQFPIDEEKRNFVRTVRNAIFSQASPTSLRSPKLVMVSRNALENCLELNYSDTTSNESFCDFVSGNHLLNASFCHR